VGVVSYRAILAEGKEGEVVDSTYDCYEGNRLPRGPQHQPLAEILGDAAEDEDNPLTCVAHSFLPHNDCVQGDQSSPGAVEAFVLRRIESSAGATTDASTAAEGGSSDRPPKQHRRHVSGSGSAGASSLRVVDSLDNMTIDSSAGLDAPSVAGMGSQPPKAILVVSGLRIPIHVPSSVGGSEDATITAVCEKPLTYIPLAIRATVLVQKDGTRRVAVFVSGDDDARLHLYMPKEENNASNRAVGISVQTQIALEEVPIFLTSKDYTEEERSENLLSFSSKIMSIDCSHSESTNECNDDDRSNDDTTPTNYIAMGCQDGIVRVLSYIYEYSNQNEHAFTVVGSSDLAVDGPIVTLDISSSMRQSPATDDSSIPQKTLVVGSLCGFACAFHQSGGADQPFGRPQEIISNLWCGRIGAEDGVLCVKSISVAGRDGLHPCVAVGTYSGRVLLFERTGRKSIYKLHWSCQLPYPIHAISAADLDGDDVNEILVTTRRSIHVYSTIETTSS